MALRIGEVSFMTPPLPSGTSISKLESAQTWSCTAGSSGRPLMAVGEGRARFEETHPKRFRARAEPEIEIALQGREITG